MFRYKNIVDIKIENQLNYSSTQHLHIRGIGIKSFLSPKDKNQGFVAQTYIKKAVSVFLHSIENSQLEKINIIVTGNYGMGKTGLCIAIAFSVDRSLPFTVINSAELNFSNISKIEYLIQSIRKSIGISFYNESVVLEGEVVNIQLNEFRQNKSKTYAKLILKNNEVQSVYKIGEEIYSKILQKMIKKGDKVEINKEKNSIKKKNSINDTEQFNEIKKGELERFEIFEHFITIFELDVLNSFSEFSFSKLFIGNFDEISNEIREKIDRIIIRWQKNKKIKIIKGIILIDDVSSLTMECFSFLSKTLESILSPAFILTSNNSTLKNKKFNLSSPHGIPLDFIDRFLVIQLNSHSYFDLKNLLFFKIDKEMIEMGEESKELLLKIGIECGIRYTIYIISIISLSYREEKKKISIKKIKESFLLFIDSKRFIRYSNKIKKWLK